MASTRIARNLKNIVLALFSGTVKNNISVGTRIIYISSLAAVHTFGISRKPMLAVSSLLYLWNEQKPQPLGAFSSVIGSSMCYHLLQAFVTSPPPAVNSQHIWKFQITSPASAVSSHLHLWHEQKLPPLEALRPLLNSRLQQRNGEQYSHYHSRRLHSLRSSAAVQHTPIASRAPHASTGCSHLPIWR